MSEYHLLCVTVYISFIKKQLCHVYYSFHKLMKSAEFQITLEDEGKVMDQLAAAIRTMTEDIRYKVEAVAECGEVQRKAIIKEQLDNEIKKVKLFKDMNKLAVSYMYDHTHC